MDDDQSMEEIRCDLDKPSIAPYKYTWRPHQYTVYWCNLDLAQKKGLQFYQTRSHAIDLYNTQPANCTEKAVCMKTEEELCHKVYLSPRLLELSWSRIRNAGNRINMSKKQENPLTTKAFREVTEKPAAATLTIEYQAYLILQSNNTTRIAKKRTKSSFSSSRITRTSSLSCRTWIWPKRLIRSAKSKRSWSPTWAIPRSSSFAKPLPRNNVQIVTCIGKLALRTVHVGDV